MNMKFSPGRFYGNVLMSCELNEFRLTENIYPKNFRIPIHSHEHSYLKFITRGTYVENLSGENYVCKKSTLIYHPPGEPHSQDFNQTEVSLLRLEFSAHWLEKLNTSIFIKNSSTIFHNNDACRLAARLYREFCEMDEASPIIIEGLMLEIIGEVSRFSIRSSQNQPPRWLKQVRELIYARAAEELPLSQLAKTASVHPIHLAREFRRYYNCTVGDYIRKLRIELACRAMTNPDIPIAEIAASCGFYDQSHFTKSFKRIMNITPALYRARFCKR